MSKRSTFIFGVLLVLGPGLFAQDQTGVASLYGDEFAGRKTSSGDLYDPAKFTAAHLTYPFGLQVEVTNLDNGLKTTVTINDRGPWVKDRLIDLSGAAAKALKIDGLARVSLHPLGAGPPPPPGNPSVYFQAGSYKSLANAQARMKALGSDGRKVEIWVDGDLYRVYVVKPATDQNPSEDPAWLKLWGPPKGKPLG